MSFLSVVILPKSVETKRLILEIVNKLEIDTETYMIVKVVNNKHFVSLFSQKDEDCIVRSLCDNRNCIMKIAVYWNDAKDISDIIAYFFNFIKKHF